MSAFSLVYVLAVNGIRTMMIRVILSCGIVHMSLPNPYVDTTILSAYRKMQLKVPYWRLTRKYQSSYHKATGLFPLAFVFAPGQTSFRRLTSARTIEKLDQLNR